VLGCGVRHEMDLSGLGPMFEEFSISLNAKRRNILPHEYPSDILLSQFYFPPRLLHCTCSSLLAVTPPSSSQRRPFSKRRNRGVSLVSILEPLCLAANLAISSEYRLKNVSQQQCTPFSTKKFPGSPFLTTNPRSFCFIAINSQQIVR